MTDTLAFDDVSATALETDADVLARVTALVRNAIKLTSVMDKHGL